MRHCITQLLPLDEPIVFIPISPPFLILGELDDALLGLSVDDWRLDLDCGDLGCRVDIFVAGEQSCFDRTDL